MNKSNILMSLCAASIPLLSLMLNEVRAAPTNLATERSLSSQWQWQYRVLLVYVPTPKQRQQLLSHVEAERVGIEQRRLKVLVLSEASLADVLDKDSEIDTNINRRELSEKMAGKPSILIGLDGGVKNFYDWPNAQTVIDLKAVFADIDGMPMRRLELSESRNP